jgi:hypothetical protein
MCGRDTVTWWGVHPAMSPQVSCKSKGQHLFSLLELYLCNVMYDSHKYVKYDFCLYMITDGVMEIFHTLSHL